MTLAVRLAIGFALGATISFVATPYAIRLAGRLKFFDLPVGYKGHARPTPYLGGVAVVVALGVAIAATAASWGKTAPLLASVLTLCVVGTIDDRRSLSPLLRVVVELGLGVLIWRGGLGWHLHAGAAVDIVLTCAWVVGVVNAFNLFDNMDGAATTMALVVAGGAGLVGVVRGEEWVAASAACVCGSCAGFMPRNMAVPARIFLGDGGSMPLGFAVSVLVTTAAGTSTTTWRSLLVGILLIGIPVFDTSLVIVSRRRRGISVLQGGRDHLTHRALRHLPNPRAVALLLGALQAALSVVAVLASRGEAALVVIAASAYLLIAGAAIVVLDARRVEETVVDPPTLPLRLSKRALACLLILGLGSGLSPFFFTYFDAGVWVPVGLGVTLLCSIALVLRPPPLAAPGALAVAGVLGLGVWSLLSATWAESVETAVVGGNRWLVYGALLTLMLTLVSHERRAVALFGAVALGVLAVGVSVLARLLGSDPASLFLSGRLNAPLGYINGEGCLFAMAMWPCAALLGHSRALIAGAGAAGATLFACLAMLSESRGTALAVIGSLLAVLVLVPGRRPLVWGLLVVGAAVALAGPALLHVYDHRLQPARLNGDAHAAGRAAIVAALVSGAAWTLMRTGWARLEARPRVATRLRASGVAALALAVLAVAAVGAASADRVSRDVSTQWRAFVHLSEPGESSHAASAGRTRLLSGGGNRYDYWRIAWHVFTGHPLEGIGAGNYARPYYERRATMEDVDQPHSVWLQTLAELGIVGFGLLLTFVVGVAWGAWRMRARVPNAPLRQGLLCAGVGVFTAWLVQASVDWMALLPGLTAIALAAATVLIWPRTAAEGTRFKTEAALDAPLMAGRRVAGAATLGALLVTLIAAGASLSRAGLAQLYRSRAQRELAHDPRAALDDANRSLSIDADASATYYVKAAALARYDQAAPAEAALRASLVREPGNFVTWALLGDISVRRGDLGRARVDYARAHLLNPRDVALALLASRPGEVLATARPDA
ncbi:MAG TPA: O-antigen ligase family protein [Solirubrobacteraceae bacterium]|jgi:UDP-GlcNAc:undecaprenyl-phosphate GlcNAc-1-phosphate transferase|nr:O-antigen ligase family protein [Solirubrobacteraceae bacterium]